MNKTTGLEALNFRFEFRLFFDKARELNINIIFQMITSLRICDFSTKNYILICKQIKRIP